MPLGKHGRGGVGSAKVRVMPFLLVYALLVLIHHKTLSAMFTYFRHDINGHKPRRYQKLALVMGDLTSDVEGDDD